MRGAEGYEGQSRPLSPLELILDTLAESRG